MGKGCCFFKNLRFLGKMGCGNGGFNSAWCSSTLWPQVRAGNPGILGIWGEILGGFCGKIGDFCGKMECFLGKTGCFWEKRDVGMWVQLSSVLFLSMAMGGLEKPRNSGNLGNSRGGNWGNFGKTLLSPPRQTGTVHHLHL